MGAGLSAGEEAQADDDTGEVQERQHRGGVSVVSDRELAEGDDPCVCSLHYPAMTAQALARLHAPPCNSRRDAAPPQRPSLLGEIIPGMTSG